MAWDRLAAYDPDLWGVSQETFDSNRLVTVKLSNVGNNALQTYGEPINQYPFFSRELQEGGAKDNPLSRQFFCFGLTSYAGALFKFNAMWSDIHKKVTNSSLVGWCNGANNNGYAYSMGNPNQAQGGTNGDGGDPYNGAFNNDYRWYSNKSGTISAYSCYGQNSMILKMFREDFLIGVTLRVCPPISDGDIIPVANDNAFKNPVEMTMETWLTGDNQSTYPNIVSISLDIFQGSKTSRSRSDYGIYTDTDTYVDDIWEKVTHVSIPDDEFTFSEPRYGKLSPSGITARGYLPQKTIFTGINVYILSSSTICYWRCCRGVDRHRIIKYGIQGSDENNIDPRLISFFDGTVDDIKNILNSLGLPWTLKNSKLANGNTETDPDIYVPIFNTKTGAVKGTTNDPDKKKKELEDNPNGAPTDPTEWNPDYAGPDPEDPDDPAYDPEEDPEEEKEADEIEMGDPKLGTVGIFNRTYAINAEELHALSSYLWNADLTEFEKIIQGLALMGNNPINAIISVIMFPFEVGSGTTTNIRIGVVDTDITAVPISYSDVRVYDLGECYFWAKYKNYLDYEPYTTAALYIPYVGIIPIPVSEYLKKWINVKLAVDLMTGSGQVVVYASGIPVIYRNCKIGCQIAVTGQDSSRIAANYITAASELVGAGTGLAQSVASGNAGGIIGGTMSAARGAIDLYTAGHVPIESRGSDSPQCGFYMPQKCYLIVNRPRPADVDGGVYGRTVGYACCRTGIIGDFAGFSKFDNVKIDINVATEAEKREIIEKLRGGVYV